MIIRTLPCINWSFIYLPLWNVCASHLPIFKLENWSCYGLVKVYVFWIQFFIRYSTSYIVTLIYNYIYNQIYANQHSRKEEVKRKEKQKEKNALKMFKTLTHWFLYVFPFPQMQRETNLIEQRTMMCAVDYFIYPIRARAFREQASYAYIIHISITRFAIVSAILKMIQHICWENKIIN